MRFSWEYLTTPIKKPDLIWPYFVFLTVLILAAIILHIIVDRKQMPKFQKRFIRKIADFLLYIPILFLIVLLTIFTGVSGLNLPIHIAVLGAIWLIWFGFLIYYRLVVIKEFWKLYWKQKKEEKYVNGKSKNR